MTKDEHRAAIRVIPLVAAASLFTPFPGASAAPTSSPSGSASAGKPPVDAMSAALFSGTSSAPTEEAWKAARPLSGVRMGRGVSLGSCGATHVAEWVRISCSSTRAGRVDLLAGEARDLTFIVEKGEAGGGFGDNLVAQFSMRPGDRRVIAWLEPDMWWSVWDNGAMASGLTVMGPMFGMALQVDWASGPEPTIALF